VVIAPLGGYRDPLGPRTASNNYLLSVIPSFSPLWTGSISGRAFVPPTIPGRYFVRSPASSHPSGSALGSIFLAFFFCPVLPEFPHCQMCCSAWRIAPTGPDIAVIWSGLSRGLHLLSSRVATPSVLQLRRVRQGLP
jgi:hypothetical protein